MSAHEATMDKFIKNHVTANCSQLMDNYSKTILNACVTNFIKSVIKDLTVMDTRNVKEFLDNKNI